LFWYIDYLLNDNSAKIRRVYYLPENKEANAKLPISLSKIQSQFIILVAPIVNVLVIFYMQKALIFLQKT